MKKSGVLFLVFLTLLTYCSCVKEESKTLTAFVGAASKPPMEEAAADFEKETGIKVYLTFGGSGTLLSQIELSKSGDLYIPGSPDYIVKAKNKGIIEDDSVKIIAYLIPVIAVQHGNPLNIQSLADLAKTGIKVGIGNPQGVCVGLYATEILDFNDLLTEVGRNIVVNAESCEKTASLISLKLVDAVIGWDVFHHWDPENIDTVHIKAEQLPRLAYIPGAIIKFSADKENAQKFLDFLMSEKGQQIFQKWGYTATEEEARTYAPDAEIHGEYQLPASYQP